MTDQDEPKPPVSFANPIKKSRAERLRAEASNCIALAVDAGNDPFAGELLNEAIKLAARAKAKG